MSVDMERVSEYMKQLEDHFEAYELVEALGLTTDEIIDAFWDKIIDSPNLIELKEERI